jgi:competence protein ComEC
MEVTGFRGETELWAPVRALGYYAGGEWHEGTARVQLRMPSEGAPLFLTGTRWEASGVLRPVDGSYVGLHRSNWRFEPDPNSLEELPGPATGKVMISFFAVRAWLSERIALSAPDMPETIPLLQTLLLGQRSELDQPTLQRFARTGLIHVFAVSGLHLGLLAGMLFFACRIVWVPYRYVGFVTLPLLFAFTLCTGMRASALRAFIMIACMQLAPVVYRFPRLQNGFALALVLILGYAPGQISDLGFQFSFLLVAGLLAFGRQLGDVFEDLVSPDPWAPESERWRWWHHGLLPRLQGALLVTVICFVISAPLTAYTFNLFSPIGLLGNLAAVPLVFCVLAAGFPALLTLWMPIKVSMVAFFPARLAASWLLNWVNWLEDIPGGYQWVRAPALWQLLLFYVGVGVWWRFPRFKTISQAVLLGLAGYLAADAWQFANRTEVVVVDADRGQMAWLRAGQKGIVMVDAGSDWSGWQGARALTQRGVNRVESLFITHPDRYHVEGYRHVQDAHPPERVWVSTPDKEHRLFRNLTPVASAIHQGQLLQTAGWTVEVLHPDPAIESRRGDSRSLVLRFTKGFQSVLVMGGAGAEVEQRILAETTSVAARLVLAGHPRSGDVLIAPFLEQVNPESVIFAGRGFHGILPGREAAESRVLVHGSRVYRVDDSEPFALSLK